MSYNRRFINTSIFQKPLTYVRMLTGLQFSFPKLPFFLKTGKTSDITDSLGKKSF